MSDAKQMEHVPGGRILSVALIGPDEQRRKSVAGVLSSRADLRLSELPSFPPSLDKLLQSLAHQFDVILVDADSDPDYAFALVEKASAAGLACMMAYSAQAEVKLAIRFMRAGAREFFTFPLDPAEVGAALARVSISSQTPQQAAKILGRTFVFLGTKGGCGVTTLAANFALVLAQESEGNTLLIDLGLPLGDAAINLGISATYSVAYALQDSGRLDANFLSTLVTRHDSGLSVLAAPTEFSKTQPQREAFDKLQAVARQSFDYVVVDAGSRIDLMDSAFFEESATVFLVTQVGISELRNANRMISQFFTTRGRNLQIVLNRYKPNDLLLDEKQIDKALTRPAQWKIPDDYAAARRTRDTATPVALVDSALSQAIHQMARTTCGLPASKNGRKGLFSFLR
jgi:pilus assembly protein CpaE